MAQEYGARGNAINKIDQLLAVGVRGEVEVLQLTLTRELAGPSTEKERLSWNGRFEASAGGLPVRITDEKNCLALIANHPHGQIMRGGILAHHSGSEHENPAPGELHRLELNLVQHDEIKRFGQP